MVDGKTIEKLRLDLNDLTEEVKQLRQRVTVLEKNEGFQDVLRSKEFQDYMESIKKLGEEKKE